MYSPIARKVGTEISATFTGRGDRQFSEARLSDRHLWVIRELSLTERLRL